MDRQDTKMKGIASKRNPKTPTVPLFWVALGHIYMLKIKSSTILTTQNHWLMMRGC
jgi:hypothetical protein